jgi:hypothetical protein
LVLINKCRTTFTGLQIRCPRATALNIIAKIQYYPRKEINYQRETNGNERCVNKEKPYFGDRNIKALAQISANPKGVTFKKGEDPL